MPDEEIFQRVHHPMDARLSSHRVHARLGPDRDRVLKPADRLGGLRHQWPKHHIRTAQFGLRALNEIVARHQRAVERAGQGFEPACGVHGRTDHGKFKTGQSDVTQNDGP